MPHPWSCRGSLPNVNLASYQPSSNICKPPRAFVVWKETSSKVASNLWTLFQTATPRILCRLLRLERYNYMAETRQELLSKLTKTLHEFKVSQNRVTELEAILSQDQPN